MKRSAIIFALLLISFLIGFPTSSALEISLSKQSYHPQETLQAEIITISNLEKQDILLYKKGTPRPMPVESDLISKNNKYYFYMILPDQQGDFYITINDAEVKNFTITQTDNPALSIEPGFIFATTDVPSGVSPLHTTAN